MLLSKLPSAIGALKRPLPGVYPLMIPESGAEILHHFPVKFFVRGNHLFCWFVMNFFSQKLQG